MAGREFEQTKCSVGNLSVLGTLGISVEQGAGVRLERA
jgi:hypothetical protein